PVAAHRLALDAVLVVVRRVVGRLVGGQHLPRAPAERAHVGLGALHLGLDDVRQLPHPRGDLFAAAPVVALDVTGREPVAHGDPPEAAEAARQHGDRDRLGDGGELGDLTDPGEPEVGRAARLQRDHHAPLVTDRLLHAAAPPSAARSPATADCATCSIRTARRSAFTPYTGIRGPVTATRPATNCSTGRSLGSCTRCGSPGSASYSSARRSAYASSRSSVSTTVCTTCCTNGSTSSVTPVGSGSTVIRNGPSTGTLGS